MSPQKDKETIEVKRRRQSASGGVQRDARAESPIRRRPGLSGGAPTSGGGAMPPSGGGLPPSGGGGLPFPSLGGSRGKTLPIGCVVVIIVLYFAYQLLSSGAPQTAPSGQSPADQPLFGVQETSAPALPTSTPRRSPTRTPGAAASGAAAQKWLVMLYQDADDQILEQDILTDLNEAELIGSSDQVQIVAQVDRYRSGYSGDGDWTAARRYAITQDGNLQRLGSELVDELGEVNMADAATLVDFVRWAVESYPADKHVLILSDHGMGWPGGWSDPAPGGRDSSRAPIASALGDNLFLMELEAALDEITASTGIGKLELIGMDACLMGHLEVLASLAPYARYAVTSQETEPALGWAYTGFLGPLVENPAMSGAELSSLIVESYIVDDQRIVDDQARAEFLRQGSPMGGLFGGFAAVSAADLADQLGRSVTISAVDLEAVPGLMSRTNDLAYALQGASQQAVASARSYAQSFTSVFGREVPPSYIDLGNFTQYLKREAGGNVSLPADALLASLGQAVIAEKHGRGKPGATGVSIYFPNSTLYNSPVTGPQSYTAVARRFAQESLWDDFLAFHYLDRSFSPQPAEPVLPGAGAAVRAPGAGQIEVGAISASSNEAAPGQPVQLSLDIAGQNIGYIYYFAGYLDRQARSIFVADSDYLESPETRQVEGVFYPVWSQGGEFTMQFEWEPTVFAISDGVTSAPAVFKPDSYGASADEAVYTVDGYYQYANGERRYARLYFQNGSLRQVFGFTGSEPTGAPREIIPQAGDTFTVLESWLDMDASGNVTQSATQEGGTLTFGSQMFAWEEVFAAAGEYVVGFIIEDLDGNRQQVFTAITVR